MTILMLPPPCGALLAMSSPNIKFKCVVVVLGWYKFKKLIIIMILMLPLPELRRAPGQEFSLI